MREGWTYKKLGEVITPAKVIKNRLGEDLPILSITMHEGIVSQKDRFKKVIASVDTSEYKIVKNGQLVIAFPIDEGLLYTQDLVEEGIMSPAYNIWDVDYNCINRSFLVRYLHCPFAFSYYKSKLRGTTMRRRNIPREDLLNMPLPLPPKSQQEAIVSELDEINSLLALKREQLQKYDKLAQSLFYEMFGDPVENEKEWEVKKLGDVCKFSQGMQVPIDLQKLDKEIDDVRFLRIIDFTQGKEPPRYIEKYDKKCFITKNDIAIVRYGTPGFVCFGKEGVIANNLFRIIPEEDRFLSIFLVHWLNSSAFQDKVKGTQYGAALQAIKFSTISPIKIILPPLPLQQQFASRIEQIESQKQQVQAAIEKLETLLASRMQYWFE